MGVGKRFENLTIEELENICGFCDIYNSNGCINVKGTIACESREILMKYKINNNIELPYNWRRV